MYGFGCTCTARQWTFTVHWDLLVRVDAIRASSSRDCSSLPPITIEVAGAYLERRAWHNLLRGKRTVLDEATNAVVDDVERCGSLGHREPLTGLLGRAVRMDVVHVPHREVPRACIFHPWTSVRFDATHPRQEPGAGVVHAGIRTGRAQQLAALPRSSSLAALSRATGSCTGHGVQMSRDASPILGRRHECNPGHRQEELLGTHCGGPSPPPGALDATTVTLDHRSRRHEACTPAHSAERRTGPNTRP